MVLSRGPRTTAKNIKEQILSDLDVLAKLDADQLREDRLEKFLNMGHIN